MTLIFRNALGIFDLICKSSLTSLTFLVRDEMTKFVLWRSTRFSFIRGMHLI